MAPKPRSNWERFWPKVDASGDCWEWTASCSLNGYGQFWFSRDGAPKTLCRAHRVSWELLVGPIPDGLVIDHRCRNTRCVNPDHLEPVTPEVNAERTRRSHCLNGHPFVEGNMYTYPLPSGAVMRMCRTCHRDREREYRPERAARKARAA